MPERIQRKRTKGWRMPEGAVYVGRPTKWGNPYWTKHYARRWEVSGDMTVMWPGARYGYLTWFPFERDARERVVEMFRLGFPLAEEARAELAGRDLACWCPLDQPCHADVLLELANQPEDREPEVEPVDKTTDEEVAV